MTFKGHPISSVVAQWHYWTTHVIFLLLVNNYIAISYRFGLV